MTDVFTGLVREIGTLTAVVARGGVTVLTLRAPVCAPDLVAGDSLAVDGICLTVTSGSARGRAADRGPLVTVEAVAETRRSTTLDDWRPGRRLHLEPALRAGDRLGGHLVLGHVDGVGRVRRLERAGDAARLTVQPPPGVARWLLSKGSVAIDGVSLTLDADPGETGFIVSLIPQTLGTTRLGELVPGDGVNLEADVLAKGAVARGTAADPAGASPLTYERILARGFRGRRGGQR
ncbi:MAG: riboflavin synthase subunit alpha [Gemmatimonas sp.]|nr:riboflavin synthase subunit alpha [Gemmatimonas sp.]